jgi:hypothetical protein
MHRFSKINWRALNSLKLSNYFSMQMIIKLEIKEANTYQMLDYTTLNICILVIDELSR